jgi:hypothetical protein
MEAGGLINWHWVDGVVKILGPPFDRLRVNGITDCY